MAPPKTLPCPSMCLVAEYIIISAPNSRGFCRIGVAKTLSTITFAPDLCANLDTLLYQQFQGKGWMVFQKNNFSFFF